MLPAALLGQLLGGAASSLVSKLLTPGAGGSGQAQRADAFASLLNKARLGEVQTHRTVGIDLAANTQLNPEQQLRLGAAVDQAEAAGLTSALVLIDGMALKVDVLSRRVTEAVDPNAAVAGDIDGVVAAPPSRFGDLLARHGAAPAPVASENVPAAQLFARLNAATSAARWASPPVSRT